MKTRVKLGLIGILSSCVAAQMEAATTNYWVQNVNIALTAYVQQSGTVISGPLPTKQWITFLSGVTNTALIRSEIDNVPITNSVYTNVTMEVTNVWPLPVTELPPGDLPRSYTITSNYVLTPDGGLTLYTNNVDFTNDVIVTRTSATNATYTFNNAVSLSSTQTAYLFPELPANSIAASWTNAGPGTVFQVSGSYYTNVVSTTTNYTYGTNPDFSKVTGAKLLFVTPMVGGFSRPSKFVVRYTSGGTNVDTDVSNFISESYQSPYVSVVQSAASTLIYTTAFTELDFDNTTGTKFNFVGYDTQLRGPIYYKTNLLSPSVLRLRKMNVSNYGGQINGQIQDRSFNNATTVVLGTITISGGKIE